MRRLVAIFRGPCQGFAATILDRSGFSPFGAPSFTTRGSFSTCRGAASFQHVCEQRRRNEWFLAGWQAPRVRADVIRLQYIPGLRLLTAPLAWEVRFWTLWRGPRQVWSSGRGLQETSMGTAYLGAR